MTISPDTQQQGTGHGGQPDGQRADAQQRQRTFSWTDPAAIAEGRIPPPPVMQALEFDGLFFEEGRAAFRLTPREFHYNPLGTVHGGVFATMLDSACGCAVHTMLPAGVFYTSLDLSLKFLRPVTVDTGPITAEATVIHLGRRTALAEGRITDAAGKVHVTATSSCLVIRPD